MKRRDYLRTVGGIGTVAALGGAGIFAATQTGAAMSAAVNIDPVSVTNDTGDVDAVYLNPVSEVRWSNFDEPVTKVRQLVEARIKQDGAVQTPQDGPTSATQNGWWPVYRETPWLFTTLEETTSLPASNGGVTLGASGPTVTLDVPDGDLSDDQYPNSANHAEVFIDADGGGWDYQIRYASGTGGVPEYAPWSYQTNGQSGWTAGLPSGVNATFDDQTDTIQVTVQGGFEAVGGYHTHVTDTESTSTSPTGSKPWQGGLVDPTAADFDYGGDPAAFQIPQYAVGEQNTLGDAKGLATTGVLKYPLMPSGGTRGVAPSPAIILASEDYPMPDYESFAANNGGATYESLLDGTSVAGGGNFANGSYGPILGAGGPGHPAATDTVHGLMDNLADGSDKETTIEIRVLTSLHTDYDFVENVPEGDDRVDAYAPLVMGASPDVDHQFEEINAIPYDEMRANADSHPAIHTAKTSFTLTATNEASDSGSTTDGGSQFNGQAGAN